MLAVRDPTVHVHYIWPRSLGTAPCVRGRKVGTGMGFVGTLALGPTAERAFCKKLPKPSYAPRIPRDPRESPISHTYQSLPITRERSIRRIDLSPVNVLANALIYIKAYFDLC